MAWIYLLIAGIFEITWAVGLKMSNGFSHLWFSIFTIRGMILSFYFLAIALKNIPLGTAYAIWTGIGTVGTVILGMLLFKEPLTIMKLVCIVMIFSGIAGLKLLSA